MKTKTYVLTLSKTFPKGHPREGEETRFAEKLHKAIPSISDDYPPVPKYIDPYNVKIHTIRANYDLWKRRIDEVNAGMAVLSVREWLGAPRRSKQRELFRFDKNSGIGVEMLDWIACDLDAPAIRRGDLLTPFFMRVIAANDGLTQDDWRAWFMGCDRTQPMAIIHFTKFRYCE